MDLRTLEEQLLGVRFDIHQADGQVLRLGHDGPVVNWHIHSGATLRRILKQPQCTLGSSYVRGDWDIDTRHLSTLIQALIPANTSPGFLHRRPFLRRLRTHLPHVRQKATQPRWRDFSLWLSRTCLGDEIFQGCSHYSEPGMSLEEAQRVRARHLIARLQLGPDLHLLDLDAGWGALPLHLAEHAGVRVTALVSNREQLRFAHGEARRRGLDGSVHFRLGGFYQCRGRFDRILGSGFLEHHPEPAYRVLFKRLETLLQDDGMIWLQVRGRSGETPLSNRWHQQQLPTRHSLPLLSDINSAVEQTALRALLTEDLSGHLLRDLESQAQRYHGRRAAISQRFGETWTRQWEFLLASEIAALRWGQLRQYELLLGNSCCRWPASDPDGSDDGARLPLDIARKIPGLARDVYPSRP